MIVDNHVHLFFPGSDPEEFLRGCIRTGAAIFTRESGPSGDPDALYENSMAVLTDREGDKLVAQMDEAGIDRAILLPLDLGLGCSEPDGGAPDYLAAAEKNELHFQVTQKHRGRLFTYLGVDPRRPGGAALFRQGLAKWHVLGLKLHPAAGFYPHDPLCNPLYEIAREAGVPVLFHSGTEPAPLKSLYSQPCYIDAVAAEYPDLKIIIAHCGHGWWREALDMALSKPNLYVDFSGWQLEYSGSPDYLYEPLRAAIDLLGPWRVLFGTDGSLTDIIVPPHDWVRAWREPQSPSGISFSEEELAIVMGAAAARLHGWD